jgi:hypothetical protein
MYYYYAGVVCSCNFEGLVPGLKGVPWRIDFHAKRGTVWVEDDWRWRPN